ncbi:MAG: AraC family transcriptional regulator ligand-binding domain-containing protein [Oceanococcus sp.]
MVTNSVDVLPTAALDVACIPSNYSRLIARELDLQVRDLPALLQRTQLTIEQFMQEDTLLTAPQQIQILKNALHLSNDNAFGLRLGQRLTPSTHGAMGFLASSSPNLLMAAQAFQMYLPTRINFARLELVNGDDYLDCYCHFDLDISTEIRRILAESFATIFFECAEFIVGRPVEEVVLQFDFAEPDNSLNYREFLPGQIEFSAPQMLLKIPKHLCAVPNASANHENYLLALQQCETMLTQLHANKHSSQYQVQRMMLSHPPGVLSEAEAAAALFISKRTLARRLRAEGTGFRQLRDDILAQQASAYLRDSQLSVDAIAVLLNYHDSANFRRAFKRWFDLSPQAYREQSRTA